MLLASATHTRRTKVEIEHTEQTIKGGSGQDLTLFIHRPKGVEGPLPCIYHM